MLYIITANGKLAIDSFQDLDKYFNLKRGEKDALINTGIRNKIFYYLEKNTLLFSDSLKNFSKVVDLELDEELVFFQKNVGFLFAPFTVYRNIKRVPCGVEFWLNDEKSDLVYKKQFPIVSNQPLDINKFEFKLSEALTSQMRNGNNCILHGGGADSSLLIALSAKNKLSCETITCEMTGMEEEANLASRISANKGFTNTIHYSKKENTTRILKEYIRENYEVVTDPVMPVIREMMVHLEGKTIIDGQGADTILLSVPHVRLIHLYNPTLSLLLRVPNKFLEKITVNKTTHLGRKFYRLKKVVSALAAKDLEECLLTSWNFPMVRTSDYLNFVKKEITEIFGGSNDKYKMFIYLFLNHILPVREMQKYEGLEEKNISLVFPYLEKEFVNLIYQSRTSDFFDGKNIKKPVYKLLAKELPGFIKKNKTKPFFVNYLENLKISENKFEGKRYPIIDHTNFAFTLHNLEVLKQELVKQKI